MPIPDLRALFLNDACAHVTFFRIWAAGYTSTVAPRPTSMAAWWTAI